MTKKEKKRILILVVVAAIIIIAMVVSMKRRVKQVAENPNAPSNQEVSNEEFVRILDDGTRLNTSTKLQETKKSNFQVTARNNETELLGTIKNTSSTKQGYFLANVKVVDKQGEELTTAQILIPELEPGESTQLISSTNFDYANAYDFTITRVK